MAKKYFYSIIIYLSGVNPAQRFQIRYEFKLSAVTDHTCLE